MNALRERRVARVDHQCIYDLHRPRAPSVMAQHPILAAGRMWCLSIFPALGKALGSIQFEREMTGWIHLGLAFEGKLPVGVALGHVIPDCGGFLDPALSAESIWRDGRITGALTLDGWNAAAWSEVRRSGVATGKPLDLDRYPYAAQAIGIGAALAGEFGRAHSN